MKLRNCIKVYVPVIRGSQISKLTKSAIKFVMCEKFGGTTECNNLFGYWKNNTGVIIKDDIDIVYSYTNKSRYALKRIAKRYADYIKSQLHQDCVSIEINNKLYIL
jgi:hypothetical protein